MQALYVCKKNGKKVTRGHSTKSETFEKKHLKNVLLASKTTLQHFLYRILTLVWGISSFNQTDNKYENNKINKQYGQVRF
jgi:hypothetical protein